MRRGEIRSSGHVFRRLAGLLLAFGACQCAGPGGKAAVSRNVVYTPPGWPAEMRADLHRPRPAATAPAVLLIHHKGLKAQDDLRWQMRGIARKLAARGYFVMNVTYRNAPRWKYPAPMEDLRAALDWMERNAAAQDIDPTRIATFGYSAGGHLALLAGLGDARVKAIVAGAAPADLMLFEGGLLIGQSLGGSREDRPEKYRAISPIYQVRRDSPPVFLYHGSRDGMIPPLHSQMMRKALEVNGVTHELHLIEGKGHMGAFLLGGAAEDRAIDFLDDALGRPLD